LKWFSANNRKTKPKRTKMHKLRNKSKILKIIKPPVAIVENKSWVCHFQPPNNWSLILSHKIWMVPSLCWKICLFLSFQTIHTQQSQKFWIFPLMFLERPAREVKCWKRYDTTFPITFLNLLTNTLYKHPTKEMGWKSASL